MVSEGFRSFLDKPKDAELIQKHVWQDIKGYCPSSKGALEGTDTCVQDCKKIIRAIPGFRSLVCDYAIIEDIVFIRWELSGKPPVGPEIINGVDRLVLQDGYVTKNPIYSDHTIYEYLAKDQLLG